MGFGDTRVIRKSGRMIHGEIEYRENVLPMGQADTFNYSEWEQKIIERAIK